jgi:hypothetical protein
VRECEEVEEGGSVWCEQVSTVRKCEKVEGGSVECEEVSCV